MQRSFVLDLIAVFAVTVVAGLVVEYVKNNSDLVRRSIN